MMNHTEVAQLLTIANALDSRRTVSPEIVTVWHQLISHLDYDVAVDALKLHYADSTDTILPAHIRTCARRVLDARARDRRRHLHAVEPQTITKPEPEQWQRMVAAAIDEHRAAKGGH